MVDTINLSRSGQTHNALEPDCESKKRLFHFIRTLLKENELTTNLYTPKF